MCHGPYVWSVDEMIRSAKAEWDEKGNERGIRECEPVKIGSKTEIGNAEML